MERYLGVKLIEAEPMTHGEFAKEKYGENQVETQFPTENKHTEGYKVKYSDDYTSWSPKEPFEKSYLELNSDKNTITQEDVNAFIKIVETIKVGEKTTLVTVTLLNGFTLTESSSCVDPANYNHEMGEEICLEKIKDKILFLLDFLLQSGLNGFSK